MRNIFTKLEVSSRTEAATLAIQRGLVTVPSPDPDPGLVEQPISEPAAGPDTAPETSPGWRSSWRWGLFIMILLAGLIIGALAGDWLRTG